MDTLDFFRQFKIAEVTDNTCGTCDNCALNDGCGAYFTGCPAPVGYNFQLKLPEVKGS